jgi:hypothetical protein
MISEDLREELSEVLTTRRRWWVIKFEDGFYGEIWDDDVSGFDLKLCSSKEEAHAVARGFLEDEPLPYEVVEICLSEVK